ncbi:hypothetical protein [Fuerstiella marisgermanici]|uniref:Uncharacterized protein n=1 Tax=Fuerstiella marisgermanici TaxID=1891926 RepID=A0A1P8WGU5_9PLAN|nr:hypothetical protein [Fuerstiella marisgermanici]APZ93260.1 hypothetical protein Fuma_02877 [Fuerstiella marisgermanici]
MLTIKAGDDVSFWTAARFDRPSVHCTFTVLVVSGDRRPGLTGFFVRESGESQLDPGESHQLLDIDGHRWTAQLLLLEDDTWSVVAQEDITERSLPRQVDNTTASQTSPEDDGFLLTAEQRQYFSDLEERLAEADSAADEMAIHMVTEQYLSQYTSELELWLAHVRAGVTIHKDAVQNAVDTVQTKRIDFQGAPREANWNGIFMAIGVVIFIEIAAVRVGMSLGALLVKGLRKVRPGAFRDGISEARKAIMSDRSKLQSALPSVRLNPGMPANTGSVLWNASRFALSPAGRKLSPEQLHKRMTDIYGKAFGSSVKGYNAGQAVIREAANNPKQVTRSLDNAAIREWLTDKEWMDIIKTGDVGKVGMKLAKETIDFGKKQSRFPESNPLLRPVDVIFKTMIQSQFDQELFRAEQHLENVRWLHSQVWTQSPETAMENLKLAASIHSEELQLNVEQAGWDQLFESESYDSLKRRVTDEYELSLWALMYADKVHKYQVYDKTIPSMTYERIKCWREVDYETFAKTPAAQRREWYHQNDEQFQLMLTYLRHRFFPDSPPESIAKQLNDLNRHIHEKMNAVFSAPMPNGDRENGPADRGPAPTDSQSLPSGEIPQQTGPPANHPAQSESSTNSKAGQDQMGSPAGQLLWIDIPAGQPPADEPVG